MIETMVLSMIFEGRFYSFSPVTFLDRMELTVIRPMMYVSEAEVKGFRNKYNLPVVENPCPVDGVTKRQYAKDLVRQINLDHPGAKENVFTAILDGNIPGWQKNRTRKKGTSMKEKAYYEKVNVKNETLLRNLLQKIPPYCKQFLLVLNLLLLPVPGLVYAYDLNCF